MVAGPSSAAIVARFPPSAGRIDANISQFLSTAYCLLGCFGRGIASCSDRRTLACGSAVACGMSSARSAVVAALVSLGVAPLPHPARRGPPWLVVAPWSAWWAASCGVRCPLSSAWASCPGWSGVLPAPTRCAPQMTSGGLTSSPGRKKRKDGRCAPARVVGGLKREEKGMLDWRVCRRWSREAAAGFASPAAAAGAC